MSSTTSSNRPMVPVSSAARPNRFGDFNTAPGRHNSDERPPQTSTRGQAFGNGGTWQPSSGIWGNNAIGGGFANAKREPSRSRAADNENFPDAPSGSGALAASSEADPWVGRSSGPWNPRDTTSPTLQSSHTGGTPPSHVRTSISSTPQGLLELQNTYSQSRSTFGQGSGFTRPQSKSSLDPSSGSFKFSRKPSFGYNNDDKENSADTTFDVDISARSFRVDQIGTQNAGFLGVGGSASREGSMPPSRASDSVLPGAGLPFGNSNPPFSSIGHTPRNSIHSHHQSFSGLSGSFSSQANGPRFPDPNQTEFELRETFAGLGFNNDPESTSASQTSSNLGTTYSPTHPNFPQSHHSSTGSTVWNDVPTNAKAFHGYENHPVHSLVDQSYHTKNHSHRLADRGSVSPAGSDYRRGLNSPKYYPSVTPPTGSEQIYRLSSREPRLQSGHGDADRRLLNLHYPNQFIYNPPFQGQYPTYDYAPPNFRQGAIPYGYPVPIPAYPQAQGIPTRPAKDQDVGVGVRSVLLEDFRSNSKSNKRYDLKDIYHHVVEFSGDQHGSRFIQQKLETANSDEKEQLFREIQPNALQLMTDVFGNYVIQKLFEHGNQVQKRVLAEQMKNHVMELSMQMYGCRVVQKALEHVLADQQSQLVEELKADVLKCVKDQNGNHVVQKAIERVPTEHIQFIIEAFRGQVHVLATHPYGCRVIQRILEYCKPHDQAVVLEELHLCASMLITDQYGNYVTQHIIQHGKPEDRAKVVKIITAQLLTLSKHKFASNVVEKSIQFGTDEQRKAIVSQLTALHSDGSSPLLLMMKDQYGNYVIQKLLAQLKGAEREAFIEDMKPQLLSLKRYNYGKQIAAIEKLIFTGPQSYAAPSAIASPTNHTMPIEINSSEATPMLTNGQNSPQSSSLPSTSVSTIDEATEEASSCKTMTEIVEEANPDVVINNI